MASIRRARSAAALLIAGLVLACGGESTSETATAGTIDEVIKSGVESQLGSPTTVEEQGFARPSTMEAWEELWAAERAAIVDRIEESGWGLDAGGTVLRGPEGFTIDLGACPAGWSNTEGMTDTEVTIGHPTSLSGTAADYSNISRAQVAIMAHYSERGFFEDAEGKVRTVSFILKDDGSSDPARTIPVVDELLDSERTFAIQTIGSPSTMKVYDKLNERCVPHPLPITGHPAWGDPVNHPWTTTSLFSYNTEALLWGSFIDDLIDREHPDGLKVGALVMNNDFGKSYTSAFNSYLAQSPHRDKIEFISETIEPSAPTVRDPMTTLAAQDVDVFIAMTSGVSCTQAIIEAAQNGLSNDASHLFLPSPCKASSFVAADRVGGDGSAADGWWIFGGGLLDINADDSKDDAFMTWAREQLVAQGHDPASSGSFSNGVSNGWAIAQALRIAGELEGGLDRANFILALRAFDMTNPMLVEGVRYNMNGNADAYLVEGSDLSRWNAAEQRWVADGNVIDLSGMSTSCAWDQTVSVCS